MYPNNVRMFVLKYWRVDCLTTGCPGLILYNGESDNGNGDFLAFGMKDGQAEFMFDVGSGMAKIRSDHLILRDWHSIRLKRDLKEGVFNLELVLSYLR